MNTKFYRLAQKIHKGSRDPIYRGEGYPKCHEIEARAALLRTVVNRIAADTRKYGGRLFVAYLPDTRYFFRDWPDCEYKMVLRLLEELQIPSIDLVAAMARQEAPKKLIAKNYYRDDIGGHYNRLGYGLVAEEIIAAVYRSGSARSKVMSSRRMEQR